MLFVRKFQLSCIIVIIFFKIAHSFIIGCTEQYTNFIHLLFDVFGVVVRIPNTNYGD